MLDKTERKSETVPAAAKSAARFRSLNPGRRKALTRSAFFVPVVYGGCHGGDFGRAVALDGTANPVASATLLFRRNGDGYLTENRSTTMTIPTLITQENRK